MDFFGGAGGYSFDLGATSGAQGSQNSQGGLTVGEFMGGTSSDNKYLLAGVGVVIVLLAVVAFK